MFTATLSQHFAEEKILSSRVGTCPKYHRPELGFPNSHLCCLFTSLIILPFLTGHLTLYTFSFLISRIALCCGELVGHCKVYLLGNPRSEESSHLNVPCLPDVANNESPHQEGSGKELGDREEAVVFPMSFHWPSFQFSPE